MTKAVIFGCSGPILTDLEKGFFERTQPLGFILFERNCINPPQLTQLIHALKECTGREDVKILIDQEGGRIARLNHHYWRVPPSAYSLGQIYEHSPEEGVQAVYDNALLIAQDLLTLGINVNCTPLADLLRHDTDPVISDRAFSSHPDTVATLCLTMIQGLQDCGITPVLKHLLGHGRATADSHLTLPVISASKHELYDQDLAPFKQILTSLHHMLRPAPWAMTAHAIYEAFDFERPATLSSKIIDHVIRGYLDFQGFLISDCLTMEALKGSMGERAYLALDAGCDAVLHCNGDIDEMIDVAAQTEELSDDSLERLQDSIPTKKMDMILPITDLENRIKELISRSTSSPFTATRSM